MSFSTSLFLLYVDVWAILKLFVRSENRSNCSIASSHSIFYQHLKICRGKSSCKMRRLLVLLVKFLGFYIFSRYLFSEKTTCLLPYSRNRYQHISYNYVPNAPVPEIWFSSNQPKNGFLRQIEQKGFFFILPNIWHIWWYF